MASMENRTRKDGETAFRVVWGEVGPRVTDVTRVEKRREVARVPVGG